MKIAIVSEYYYPSLGGITEHVHNFAIELNKLGHRAIIITGDAGEDPFTKDTSVEVIKLGKSIPYYSNGSIARATAGFGLGRRMKEILASEQFDIVHIHPPFVPMLPGLAQIYSRTVTIATLHTQFDSHPALSIFRDLANHSAKALHGRLAVSSLCVDSVHKYIDADFKIIPNGIDTNKFNGEHEKIDAFNDGKKNIFFLSRMEPRCGLQYLLGAFGILRKKRDDVRLIIGGSGPLFKHFVSMVPSSISHDVHFIGRVNGVRPNYYSTADIFCFPTTRASFGITILEAMASARPVVAFSMPAYEGIFKNGEEGLLCGNFGSENLATALGMLLDSQDLRTRIGTAARKRAMDFSWHKITKEILGYYDEIRIVTSAGCHCEEA